MTAFRFAHVADLHLDTPFSGLARVEPELAERLRDASLRAWDNVVAECVARAVAFVVVAGDVYDGARAGVRAQLRFLRGLERLSAAGIEVFVVHGNHDPRGGAWPVVREWPRGVHVFGHERVEQRVVERDGRALAVVGGVSYREQRVTDNLALGFRRSARDAPHVAVLHCNVGDDPAHGRYAPCSLDDLARAGQDYWALGHVHARRVLREHGPAVAYPGNTQARHPNEPGPRGFLVVEVGPDRRFSPEFVPADAWRFATLELDVGGSRPVGSLPELEARLLERAAGLVGEHAGRGLILRARLTGRGPVRAELARRGALAGVLARLRDEARDLGLDLCWDDLADESRPELDRAALAAGDDFVADLVRASGGLRGRAREPVAALAGRLAAHPALARTLDALGLAGLEDEAERLLEEAEALALDRLEAGSA